MTSKRKVLIFTISWMVIREVLKYWFAGTFVTLSFLVGMNQAIAFQTSLPDTDVPIQMDSVFKPITKGIKKDGYTGPALEGNNIAWDKSVLTGKIDGEIVYRFQTKYGIHNEGKQDLADQDRYKKSRSEYKVKDKYAFREGDTVKYKYSFYVPEEVKLSGERTHITGQWKNFKAGVIVYSINIAPALSAVKVFDDIYKKSEYADTSVKPEDLIFTYRGILDNDSKHYKSSAISLANKGEWQGKWHNVEITSHLDDKGSFKFVFNGETIIDCKVCDAMPNEKHNQFYEDEWAFENHAKDGLMFQFGAYQFAYDPQRIDPNKNINTVVYMKDIVVEKIK